MITALNIKQGESYAYTAELVFGGEPVPIDGWLVESWIRNRTGRVVHRFAVEVLDAALGRYYLYAAPHETSCWPSGGLSQDIRYTDAAGHSRTTRTIPVQVEAAITPYT